MAEFAKLSAEEMATVLDRARAQDYVIVEDMVNDPDMDWLFQADDSPEHRAGALAFLTKVMTLGSIVGIKSACGQPVSDYKWRTFKTGETDD